ncbi:nucleoside hydrolase [Microbacterium sp. ASV49]|uniref:Nucleoside hydrolase n=1 Tax=Microbacterium candidum TaxID=3041922 RepID=A0ABT7MVF0_9MICO|nr:nucleoside hydrolase [Microbacterium sp. ASV49]MDL9978429.1 nucleoside hydrolase [Microbacterium sp. ASV49]
MARPIIIDTDPGIDDALAIMLAAASPEVEILGVVAVAGNVGIENTAPNAAALADLLRLDVPVGRGSALPMWRTPSNAAQVHGENGFGGYELPESPRVLEPGVPLLARLIEESEDPVTVVAIGPLTNIAKLMNEYPETARKIERIVLMGGGTLDVLGNATPTAEFNIWFDPDAAVRVFGFGVPLTMVGLNATHQALVGAHHLPQLLTSGGPAAKMVDHLLAGYGDSHHEEGAGMAQHDSLAIAAVIDPEVITTRRLFVDVENTGRLTTGMTVVDYLDRWGEPNCDVAFGVDVERFRRLLDDRLSVLDATLKED